MGVKDQRGPNRGQSIHIQFFVYLCDTLLNIVVKNEQYVAINNPNHILPVGFIHKIIPISYTICTVFINTPKGHCTKRDAQCQLVTLTIMDSPNPC